MFVARVQEQFEAQGQWDMQQLEYGLRESLLKDGCRILEGLLNQPGALGAYEPEGQLHQYRSRRVQSVLGPFTLRRGYYQQGDQRSFPMDQLLGLSDSYTPGLLKLMCRAAATDGSFEEAEQTLDVYAGVQTPASQIRKMVQQVGPQMARWAQQRDEPRNAAVPTMYISYDGTGVPMRKEETRGRKGKQPDGSAITREVKLGCVFTNHVIDENGHPLRDPDSTTYVASFEPAEAFGTRILQEARLRGYARCRRAAVIGDGATWIWNLAQTNFPQARQILDFYHACEHLSGLAAALFPAKAEVEARYLIKWKKWLQADWLHRILAEARKKLPHHGPRRESAERELNYFTTNASRMNYATYIREGYFIGSGVVEAGCKTVIGKRAKQSGMFWCVLGAQHVLDIRCSILGSTDQDYWKYRHQQSLQALRPAS